MKTRWLSGLLALLTLLTGCSLRPDPVLSALAPGEERRLTVYTSHKEEVYAPVVKEFEERTGIWVEVVTGGTGELLERIASEGEDSPCDVMFGGGAESLLGFVDLFEPYASPDAALLQPGLRAPGDRWAPFSCLPIVLIYNTRLVSPGQITGWRDLLDETWRGRIAFADPRVSGSSYTAAVTLLTALGPGEGILEGFVRNLDGAILPDSGDVAAAVARGSMALGITLEETALKRQAQGESVGIVYPAEGTSALPDGTALIRTAPHRDNALAFLNFVQGADVQARVAGDLFRRPVRTDVPSREDLPPLEELALVDYDVEGAARDRESFLARWSALAGEVGA